MAITNIIKFLTNHIDRSPLTAYRWTICALIFFATTINYLDRAVISLLKSDLSDEFNWDDGDYANIEIAFKLTYALGMVVAGRIVDKLGSKIGYFMATLLWSVAAVAHSLVTGTLGFIAVRSALGVTESGNFPSAIKATAEWFPIHERALATGIFNAGANVGAVAAPLLVPYIAVHWGWKVAFAAVGSLGFVWLFFWWRMYDVPGRHKSVSQSELAYINHDALKSEEMQTSVSWLKLLSFRQTWAFVLGKFFTDPIWWFYIFWVPDFLESAFGIKGTAIAWPVATVYILSTFGSVFGGVIPLSFIKRGWPVFKARKTSMFLYAVSVLPIIAAPAAGKVSIWLAVIVIGIATSAHQAWSANIFTTVSDMFPKRAVASVTGIGGMFGALGGIVLSFFVQKELFIYYRAIGKIETAYYIMFFICGGAYLVGWLAIHLLVPKMKRIEL